MTLPDLVVQLCSWYIFCTVDIGGLSLGVAGILENFFVFLLSWYVSYVCGRFWFEVFPCSFVYLTLFIR